MQWIKLFEGFQGVSVRERFPTNEEIATAIVSFVEKYPSHDIIQSILGYIRTFDDFRSSDLLDYNMVFKCISKSQMTTIRAEFVKNYYDIIRISISDNYDLIDDAFFEIWPGVRTLIKPVFDSVIDRYTVILLNIKEEDIPAIISRILKSCSKRLPSKHRMGEIRINETSISIAILNI